MEYEVPEVSTRLVRVGEPIACQSPDVARELARALCCVDAARERFVVLHLDGAAQIRSAETVSIGGAHGAAMTAAGVFRGAIVAGAAAIIVAHNHPSGDPTPSPEDREMTRRLREAGRVLGVELLDHVIVTDCGRSSSAMEDGWLL